MSGNFGPESEQLESNFLMYIKNKFKALLPEDKNVTLMVDEIHIKPCFDYKGGNIVGSAFDTSEAASSAYVFMVSSIMSEFKDVVHIIPAKKMKAEVLHNILKKIIIGLEKIGFSVVCVVTDNNAINGKAMSLFANPPQLSIVYVNPADRCRPLFFLFDSVHLLKCIRNNWINQKDIEKTMRFPKYCPYGVNFSENPEISHAPFSTLRKLFFLESNSLLKHAYKLSHKAIYPSNLERQNVKLAQQIFNDYIVQSLFTLVEKHSLHLFADVANYINIFHKWWTIMNVQTPFKGIYTKNTYATPMTGDISDEKNTFLESFLDWLEIWGNIDGTGGKLSRETFTALKHTTHGIIEITKYCISELKMKYVLTAKFQTDKLESRFGQYRQLSGGNYNISIRQIFECEKKIKDYVIITKKFAIS